MNSMQLKAKLRNIAKERNVDFNTILRIYMFDRFIERLSKSKYKDNFILKGGFYLSTLFGIENRFTQDIDTAFKNANFNEETIVKMVKEIINIDLDDNVKIDYLGINSIKDEDEYGGFRVELCVALENIKEKFHIDIATGDPITPKEIVYRYKPILGDEIINIWAYNIETVLAEKFETILSRLELNSRMRDFYDIYLIYNTYGDNINKENLRKAIKETFAKRGYEGDVAAALDVIKRSTILAERWDNYQRKYTYAHGITYEEILAPLQKKKKKQTPPEKKKNKIK